MTTFSINPEFDCPASELTEQVVIKWFSPIVNNPCLKGRGLKEPLLTSLNAPLSRGATLVGNI